MAGWIYIVVCVKNTHTHTVHFLFKYNLRLVKLFLLAADEIPPRAFLSSKLQIFIISLIISPTL